MSRQPKPRRPEPLPLSEADFWDKLARHHLAIGALIRQWREQQAAAVLDSTQSQEAPREPRYLRRPD